MVIERVQLLLQWDLILVIGSRNKLHLVLWLLQNHLWSSGFLIINTINLSFRWKVSKGISLARERDMFSIPQATLLVVNQSDGCLIPLFLDHRHRWIFSFKRTWITDLRSSYVYVIDEECSNGVKVTNVYLKRTNSGPKSNALSDQRALAFTHSDLCVCPSLLCKKVLCKMCFYMYKFQESSLFYYLSSLHTQMVGIRSYFLLLYAVAWKSLPLLKSYHLALWLTLEWYVNNTSICSWSL